MAKINPSGGPLQLSQEQQALRDEIAKGVDAMRSQINSHLRLSSSDIRNIGGKAAELHKLIEASGIEVRHHKFMIENRGMRPSQAGFYDHIHPVEDLLKFINNQSANNDPEDQTIGHEFGFSVYCRRWGHDDNYKVRRTKAGWSFTHMEGPITTGKDGRIDGEAETGLFALLSHDSINYPEGLPGYLEWLWDRAAEDGLTPVEVQDSLLMLARWVSSVEKNSPVGIFRGFK